MQRPSPLTIFLASALMGATQAQVVRDLGSFGGPENMSLGLNRDGSVVVGYSYDPQLHPYGFRWTAATGMQSVGDLGGTGIFSGAYANGVSADGDFVVGDSEVPSGDWHAFRWSAVTGIQDLGTLGGTTSASRSVSDDGQVVVGFSTNAAGRSRAFRWTPQSGMADLGTLGGDGSYATDLSADGQVIVGYARDASGQDKAFRWTATTGMVSLGTLGGAESLATATNSDGSVVVGSAKIATGQTRAFRWSAATGMVQLPDLGGVYAAAASVDDTGDVIVCNGRLPSSNSSRAYRWSPATGVVLLDLLGQDVSVTGVSGDGGSACGLSLTLSFDMRAVRWSWAPIGALECSGEPNSLGAPAALSAYGSLTVTRRDLALRTSGLPVGAWAFLLSSRDSASVFPFSGSQGRLCLGGSYGLHRGPGQVQRAPSDGALVWFVDTATLPTPSGPISAQLGETWRFQAWYRDANPSATSNLTGSVAIGY